MGWFLSLPSAGENAKLTSSHIEHTTRRKGGEEGEPHMVPLRTSVSQNWLAGWLAVRLSGWLSRDGQPISYQPFSRQLVALRLALASI